MLPITRNLVPSAGSHAGLFFIPGKARHFRTKIETANLVATPVIDAISMPLSHITSPPSRSRAGRCYPTPLASGGSGHLRSDFRRSPWSSDEALLRVSLCVQI